MVIIYQHHLENMCFLSGISASWYTTTTILLDHCSSFVQRYCSRNVSKRSDLHRSYNSSAFKNPGNQLKDVVTGIRICLPPDQRYYIVFILRYQQVISEINTPRWKSCLNIINEFLTTYVIHFNLAFQTFSSNSSISCICGELKKPNAFKTF